LLLAATADVVPALPLALGLGAVAVASLPLRDAATVLLPLAAQSLLAALLCGPLAAQERPDPLVVLLLEALDATAVALLLLKLTPLELRGADHRGVGGGGLLHGVADAAGGGSGHVEALLVVIVVVVVLQAAGIVVVLLLKGSNDLYRSSSSSCFIIFCLSL